MQLIQGDQFDTVYHEHFSYLSLGVVSGLFQDAGLRVFDVQELPTHGGSLRVFGCLAGASHDTRDAVADVLRGEEDFGLTRAQTYQGFTTRAEAIKNGLQIKKYALPPGVRPGGHGGSHGYLGDDFIDAILRGRTPAVDVIAALNMTVPGYYAHLSSMKDGETMKIPQYSL